MKNNEDMLLTFFFLSFFLAGWIVKALVVPYKVSKRNKRAFKFGLILPEEMDSLTREESYYLKSVTFLGFLGFLFFVGYLITNMSRP